MPSKRGELSDRLEQTASVLPETILRRAQSDSECTLKDCATSFGNIVDKMLLLQGQPTSIAQTQSVSEEERCRMQDELYQTLKANLVTEKVQ